MFNDASGFSAIYIACGYTDLRLGIDGLSRLVENRYGIEPFQTNTLFLFCGRRTDWIKGLVWEQDGFLLLYKRLEKGRFQWPRNEQDVRAMSEQQFRWLMEGLTLEPKQKVHRVKPSRSG